MTRFLLSVFFVAVSTWAQQFTQLSGTVADPSGALVPNAIIRIEDVLRGISREVKSDNEGLYRFAQVQPGTYKLTAQAEGFNDLVIGALTLEVARPATQNLVFERVGAVSTTVSVSAEGTQVNTTDATIGNVVNNTAILELPSFARNLTGLLAFQPGVTFIENVNAGDDRSGAVNGGKSDQSNITLDGMDVNSQSTRASYFSVLRPTLDSTQEFRATTSGASAEFGRSSGAQIQLVTRSGTNEFHGAAYWYHRNTVTAANTFFNNASNVKRPPLLINIPGGRLGGPIIKNKLFFFANFETRRDASNVNVLRTVPSDLMRQGILQYNDRNGQVRQIGPAGIRALDPAGIGVSQNVLRVLQAYPAANDFSAGDGLNRVGHRFSAPINSRENTYITRWDFTPNARHTFFFRGNLQNDSENDAPQFHGQAPASVILENAKGFAIGHTAVLSPNLISTFNYGLTRRSTERTGQLTAPFVTFRFIDDPSATSTLAGRTIPVHQIRQDFAWNKGKHDVRIGGTLRWIDNRSFNNTNSFTYGTTNINWIRGAGEELLPADLLPSETQQYGIAAAIAMGLVSEVTSTYNFDLTGNALPQGAIIRRNFKNEEYEWYINDSWKLRRNLTLNLGVRHSLMPAPYEADGFQLSTNQPLGAWFDKRQGLADQGLSQAGAGSISYILASSAQGRPIYPFRKGNFAPRASIAYSPDANDSLTRFLFGAPGKTSIRAGWGLFYDLIGQPLAAIYETNAFGFRQQFTNPANQQTVLNVPRYTSFNGVPASLVRPAPRGAFPATPDSDFTVTGTIDDALQMPYVMRQNFSVGREFKDGLFIEVGYVGSLSRKSLVQRDVSFPTNLKDPASGQDYFNAASQMTLHRRAGGTAANIAPIPFFERMYANFAGGGRTATQNIFQQVYRFYNQNDFLSVLSDIDHFCSPQCGALGPNAQFNDQFSALSALSSLGGGSYHAMQATVRKRWRDMTADFNWTWSKSIDMGSRAEEAGIFNSAWINPLRPNQFRAVSDYDQRHIYSSFVVWDLPFGKSKRFASGVNTLLDGFIGGWTVAPTFLMGTELPRNVTASGVWPTNWQVGSRAVPKDGGIPAPIPTRTKNTGAPPNVFANPAAARLYWDYSLPGESGGRNQLRQDGTFNINLALSKRIRMPFAEGHSIQIRAEAYNLSNAVRFIDPNVNITSTAAFGRYQQQANSPRQMQFAFRYDL
jgi:hypothetical protein